MKTKTFRAPTTKEALSRISRELGPDAIIVDQRKIRDAKGQLLVEVVASPRDAGAFAPEAAPTFWQTIFKNKAYVAGGIGGLFVIALIIVGAIIFWPRAPEETVEEAVPVLEPGEMPTLAILYFENGTGDDELDQWRVSIANLLTTDLAQSKYLRVVSGDRVYKILADLGQLEVPSFSSEILEKVASNAKASHLVTGRYMKASDRFVLTLQLRVASTGVLIATEKVEGRGEESIFAMVDDLTIKIKENLGFDDEKIASDIDDMIGKFSTKSPEAVKLWTEGMQHFWNKDYDLAIPLLEKAISIDPEFVASYISISNAYNNMAISAKSYEWALKALEHLDRASIWERHMAEVTVYWQSAQTIDKAIEAQQETLKVYTDDYWALSLIGLLHGWIEDFETAAEYLERAYRILPDNAWITIPWNLVHYHVALGHLDKAEETLQLLKETFPDDHRAYNVRFWHYIRRHDLKQAEVEAARAIELGPKTQTRHFEPVLAYYKGDYVEAERIYESYISNDSLGVQNVGRNGLVGVDVLFGRINKALSHYQPMLELTKQQDICPVLTHVNFARLHALLGNHSRAIEYLDKGLAYLESLPVVHQRHYPGKLLALALKGEYQLGLNRIDQALETAEKLKKQISEQHNPKLIRYYHYLMGNIALKQGENKAAIEQFKQALDLLSGQKYNPRNIYYLATAYFINNDLDNAEKYYLRVLSHPQTGFIRDDLDNLLSYFSAGRPDLYAKSLYMLGKVYQRQGESAKAIEYYEKFLDLWGEADPELKEPHDARSQLAILRGVSQ